MVSETHNTGDKQGAGSVLAAEEAKQVGQLLREFVGTSGENVNFDEVNLEDDMSEEAYDSLLTKLDAIAAGE